jgi:hypothetical protein
VHGLHIKSLLRKQLLWTRVRDVLLPSWVDLVMRQERLEGDLTVYKANLVKESIRMGHNDLGDFFYAAGDLQARLALPLVNALHGITRLSH